MKDLLSTVGTIAVELGGGWISRYEAGILRPGEVLRSEVDAGMAQRVTLNGAYLCEASIAIAGGRFLARIERFEPESLPPALPERGDEATELLPFSIRLGAIEAEIGALKGVGRLSYIDLDRAWNTDEDAELLVAGQSLAIGKVVVIGERFGIRITRRLTPAFDGGELRTTGALLSPTYSAEKIKDYDFTKPDCFTLRGILRAQEIHLEFLRGLNARLSIASKFRLACVDQLAYHEWTTEIRGSERSFASFSTTPPRSREAGDRLMPAILVCTAAAPSLKPLGTAELGFLREYAERQLEPIAERPVIASMAGSARALLDEDPDLALTGACLRNGWKLVADLRIGRATSLPAAPGEEKVRGSEMILIARFESPDGGALELVYPVRSLEACFAALTA